jgi:hypothetical protein
LSKITEAELPLPATKFIPCTVNGKLITVPARTLEGRMTSISGPDVNAIEPVADFVGSALLVATMEIASGEGAAVGAL